MDTFPTLAECIETFVYPPCLFTGLLAGFVTRHWALAALLAFMAAPALEYALNVAFSDGHPRFLWRDALVFGIVAALIALAVWGVRRALRAGASTRAAPEA